MSTERPNSTDSPPMSASPPSLEEVLRLQRDVIAQLMRSAALARGDVESALHLATEAAARLLDVRRASVWRFDETRTSIECLDLYDAATTTHASGLKLEESGAPRYFAAAREERCIVAHDARRDPRTSEFESGYLDVHDITAMLDAPVLVRGQLMGVVCHEHVGSPRRWRYHEELLAGTLADFVGMALGAAEHATQARELGVLRDDLERLVEVRTRALEQSRENVRALFEISPMAMILVRVADNAVVLANQRAPALFEAEPAALVELRAPEFWHDDAARSHLLRLVRERGLVEDFEAELVTSGGRRFWGSLSARELVFEAEPSLLVTVHDVTERKALEERLRTLATTDGLTGIYNRRHFFELAAPMLLLAERHGRALATVMIDVDHFKAINDAHGHAVGDEALRLVAQVCVDAPRKSDVLARYGGEELVVLLPETDADAAAAAVERIRSELAARASGLTPQLLQLTVSAGVAERRAGESLDSLLRRADAALYQAKHEGRDRVCVAP